MRGIGALALYLVLAAVFLGRGLIGRFSTAFIGVGPDPRQYAWLMAWWPHALSHGLNPLFTDKVWAPHGVNLAWTMTTPLAHLAAIPAVMALGPIATCNLLCLIAIGLAAWCGFILCRYVTDAYWPSILGGYVFGFSGYMLGQAMAHLNLVLVFPLPLLAMLLIRGWRADISRRALVAGLALVLTAQFLLFVELFATMTMFVGIAFIVIIIVGSSADRKRAVNLLPAMALSYAITLVVVSPYIYLMLSSGYEPGAPHPLILYSTDLLSLVIPTPTMELGRVPALRAIAGRSLGNIFEDGGYLGIPLILIVVSFARRWWSEGWGRLLAILLVTAIFLSLGPFLLVAGRPIVPLPGRILGAIPLLGKAQPGRLMLYASFPAMLMVSIWLDTSGKQRWIRVVSAVLVVLSMMPNLAARFWTTPIDVPSFFRDRLYTKYLSPDETVVVLPYGYQGNSMLWQLKSNWYFKMAGGNVGPLPRAFMPWPMVRAFYRVSTTTLPDPGDQLKAFLGAHRVDAVLVDDRQMNLWRPLMATLNVVPVNAGGMTIYRLPASELAPWRNATGMEMEKRAVWARFRSLIRAAAGYLDRGLPAARLTLAEVRKMGLMPKEWVVVPEKPQPPFTEGGINLPSSWRNPRYMEGMWLSVDNRGHVEVSVVGSYPALRTIVRKYRADAVGFSPPDLGKAPQAGKASQSAMLTMTFDRNGISRAAALAARRLHPKKPAATAAVPRHPQRPLPQPHMATRDARATASMRARTKLYRPRISTSRSRRRIRG